MPSRSAIPFTLLLSARIAQSVMTGFTVYITEAELGEFVGDAHRALGLECKRCFLNRYLGYDEDGRAWSVEIREARPLPWACWPASRVAALLGAP